MATQPNPKPAAKTVAPAAPAPKTVAPKAAKTVSVSPEQRWKMIADAAYFIAEKRGFTGGDPAGDWIQAEKQIDSKLR